MKKIILYAILATFYIASNAMQGPNAVDIRLYSAILFGDIKAAQQAIIDGACVKTQDVHGNMPLHNAIIRNNLDLTRLLLAAGANVQGVKVIYLAAVKGSAQILNILMKCGANIEATNANGETALHLITSSNSNYTTAIKRLLAAGANIDAQDVNGDTLLHKAAERNDEPLIALLLIFEANIDVKNNNGKSPIDFTIISIIKKRLEENASMANQKRSCSPCATASSSKKRASKQVAAKNPSSIDVKNS